MVANIRLVTSEDSRQILDIYSPVVSNTPISFELDPPTVSEISERIKKTLSQYPWLVCESHGMITGYAYASRFRERAAYQWSAEVTAYVHEQHRGHGIGKALYVSLLELLAYQGYYTALAGITLPNPGSVALHESMGFKPVGIYHNVGYKRGQWHDVGWWERALQTHRPDPALPRSVQDIVLTEAFSRALELGRTMIRA